MIKAVVCFLLAAFSFVRLKDLHSRTDKPTGIEWLGFMIAVIAGLYFI